MADTLKDLLGWYVRDLARHAAFQSHVQLVGQTSGIEADGSREDHTTLQLYTDRNRYRLRVVERWAASGTPNAGEPVAGYLGCTAGARKSRAGEDWTRGTDLADGVLCEDTWLRILRDIVGYELVQVHQGAAGDRLALPSMFDVPQLGASLEGRGAAAAQAQDAGTAFLRRLATERGAIVSSGDCDHLEIANAQATGRFWVDADGLGYVLRTKEWLQRIHAADGYMQAKAPDLTAALAVSAEVGREIERLVVETLRRQPGRAFVTDAVSTKQVPPAEPRTGERIIPVVGQAEGVLMNGPAAIDPETLAENGYHGPKARDLRDPPA